MDQPARQGNSSASSRQAPCPKKPIPANDLPSFTFIDHDDNLASKRIKDANARKAIRSHVMRDVRRRERLAGLKRVSKRDKKVQASPDAKSPESGRQLLRPRSGAPLGVGSTIVIPTRSRKPPSWNPPIIGSLSDHVPSPFSEPGVSYFDPFWSLPGFDDIKPVVDRLMKHLALVMLPMTFPVEARHPKEAHTRIGLFVANAMAEPGPFFSNLCLAAAHKAILRTEIVDYSQMDNRVVPEADLYVMKAQALREMNKKLHNPETAADSAAFETVIFLISAAVTIGLFNEAQMHFEGVKKMVESRGGIGSPSFEATRTLGGVLLCDVKIACGLLRRPYYPITWDIQPMSPALASRIAPAKKSPLNRVTSRLQNSPYLSDTLKAVIAKIREMVLLENFNREDSIGLTSEELEFYRLRVHELEHELLDYPYRIFSKAGTKNDATIPPVENVARLACICYISTGCVVAPPNSGVGRAITTHVKAVLERCPPDRPTRLGDDVLDLLAWAAFLGAFQAGDQLERPWFLHRIRHIAMLRGWKDWNKVEDVLRGHIYVPHCHLGFWRRIWNDAMTISVVFEEDTEIKNE
ncbi:hypothetical protein D8B26_004652 [Coccidioides posadasii str. Silveira]|uniref:Uncharacterized protein n=1 Tax=Coccidioides posadasii (strain RMSCC 757 / Silveira) TaxID=443226 RepID=E9D728_COCPS|nr:conserved hypothetical protein [Coccidioides posadasii str. Silveira]QVM09989.1 hypothetical protein D8B26_004652 [Coccidioides posadasii str. Silveira]